MLALQHDPFGRSSEANGARRKTMYFDALIHRNENLCGSLGSEDFRARKRKTMYR
jgi:hypothetical protein